MPTLTVELEIPGATSIKVDDVCLTAKLADGRSISAPLTWYPRLAHASQEERDNWELHAAGLHIHWADLDEDLSVEMLLAGIPSGESPTSFRHWLEARRAGHPVTIHEIGDGEGEEKEGS